MARMASKHRDRAPHVERVHGHQVHRGAAEVELVESDDADATWADVWVYDDLRWPLIVGYVNVGDLRDRNLTGHAMVTYDDILPGCFEQGSRLKDMDLNNTEAQLCFPTVPRFCGQLFLERKDKEFAHLCLKTYNDWVIDDWCGGAGHGRLIPNIVVPLWDANLAATEIHRCADKGTHAVAFSEAPVELGLPSIHSGWWDPFLLACEQTETVINMHVGSSSKMPTTAPDAPFSICAALIFENVLRSMVDWLMSGVLARYPRLRIAFSEGQVGWMPFVLQRLDSLWERGEMYDHDMRVRLPDPPSSYVPGRVYGCVFDDVVGLQSRDVIGMGQIMFETDYPHSDSTFPHSADTAQALASAAGLSDHEMWQFLRGNAIECYRLESVGITQ
ncbi:MAG: hypothetical protein JWO37_3711 [Acidimicrobiales bacterium]|nr:hypothetical protein [Acidimicrobiales bacterium]